MQVFSGIFKTAVLGLVLVSCSTLEPRHKASDPQFVFKARTTLEKFVETSRPNRVPGSAGHNKAFLFIKDRFEKIAKETKGRVIIHEFTPDVDFAVRNYQKDFDSLIRAKYPPSSSVYKKWFLFTQEAISFVKSFRGIKGQNIILEIPGKSDANSVIYVGAHYDSILSDQKTLKFIKTGEAPGADDNGSGVSALLTAAEELKNEKPDRTLRFVAFDFEEVFFLGSYALASDISSQHLSWMKAAERTVGLINLEMIGHSKTNLESQPVVKLYTRQKDQPGAEQDLDMANFFVRAALLLKSPAKFSIYQNGFNRSDNWPFWQKSLPALCVSQDWEKDFNSDRYHTALDTPESLNYSYFEEITRVLTETIAELAHISAPDALDKAL